MYQHFCKFGITCCMINHYTSIGTLNQLFHDFNSNNPQTKIVLITPESFQRKEFQNIYVSVNEILCHFRKAFVRTNRLNIQLLFTVDARREVVPPWGCNVSHLLCFLIQELFCFIQSQKEWNRCLFRILKYLIFTFDYW